ncbi:hypothetical protein CWM58_04005 [Klebsiella sp. H-Nf2]|uniref:hypothetical protein n=1 Tax=Klebsiella TaxID=570 RepID=UPI000C284635|nr:MULTISPECIES: hypothetical protein [Klebsiella]PJR52300.1 hypothetical protein CWM58_04005 [Klebsiella sp. H-Nf2]PJX44791.1 hypothetical protein CWM62_02575 [Klebsiella sp. C-Nf10]PJX55019.1 hypothetical protein CWM54_05755 [Klebsiella sp. D-Nf1]VGP63302.1 hypothetical protein SB5387_00390 [Klebsiella variicola]
MIIQPLILSLKTWFSSVLVYEHSSLKPGRDDLLIVNSAIFPLMTLGVVSVIIISFKIELGYLLLWVMACLSVGAGIGFLFGIPRAGNKDQANKITPNNKQIQTYTATSDIYQGRPNTNLEEVSDWLTKIIIGLTLVNLKTLGNHLIVISNYVAASMSDKPNESMKSLSIALILGFSTIGFLCGYLYTRLFLQGAFQRSDSQFYKTLDDVLKADADEFFKEGTPVVPTPTDVAIAKKIKDTLPGNNPDAIKPSLHSLVNNYEQARISMPSGDKRTLLMSSITAGMRRLGFAAKYFLPQLTVSNSPGERLAAVCILQMEFDPNYITWLANRLFEEPAFCGYQAASVLSARMALVGSQEKTDIRNAVKNARQIMTARNTAPDAGRDALIDKIIAS